MSKINLKLLNESLIHWERMVDRCKWLVESGYNLYLSPLRNPWKEIGESPTMKDCVLCNQYFDNNSEYCDCDIEQAPWFKTMRYAYTLEIFIDRAERFMIPALKKCIEIEEGKE